MKLIQSTSSVATLVALRELHTEDPLDLSCCVFCTISPNPRVMVPISGRAGKRAIPYGLLPPRLQYEYCMKFLQRTYLEFYPDAEFFGCAEFDTSNKVHFHFLMFDPKLFFDQHIRALQADLKACHITILNMNIQKGKNKSIPVDHMNHICRSNRSIEAHCLYLDKEWIPEGTLFKTFYIGGYADTILINTIKSPPSPETITPMVQQRSQAPQVPRASALSDPLDIPEEREDAFRAFDW